MQGNSFGLHQKKKKKKNVLAGHEKTQKNLKSMLLWKKQWKKPEKATYYMILTIKYSGKGKNMETLSITVF